MTTRAATRIGCHAGGGADRQAAVFFLIPGRRGSRSPAIRRVHHRFLILRRQLASDFSK